MYVLSVRCYQLVSYNKLTSAVNQACAPPDGCFAPTVLLIFFMGYFSVSLLLLSQITDIVSPRQCIVICTTVLTIMKILMLMQLFAGKFSLPPTFQPPQTYNPSYMPVVNSTTTCSTGCYFTTFNDLNVKYSK